MAFAVRTHLRASSTRVLPSYANELATRLRGVADTHILMEHSGSDAEVAALAQLRLQLADGGGGSGGGGSGVRLFAHSWADVLAFFGFREWPHPPKTRFADGQGSGQGGPPGWIIHTPSLLLWLASQPGGYAAYKHVWVVEHDAIFRGDLASLVHTYALESADYLGKPAADRGASAAVASGGRAAHRTWSPQLVGHVYIKREHAERYSTRLLLALKDAFSLGLSGWGESHEITICHLLPWCRVRLLCCLGHPYCQNKGPCTVTRARWDSPVGLARERWYHAVHLVDGNDAAAELALPRRNSSWLEPWV